MRLPSPRSPHRRGRDPRRIGGWTVVELITVIAIIALATGVVLTIVSRARKAAARAGCLSNLRQISSALIQYASDNSDRFPDPYNNETSWEFSIRKYIADKQVFRCDADGEIYPILGSSYDWRDTGKPESTLAGRSLLEVRRHDAVLAFEALPGWHDRNTMNAARIDGSVQVMDRDVCLKDLMLPVR